jgi:hypothetical protein
VSDSPDAVTTKKTEWVDPVKVNVEMDGEGAGLMWKADCDDCGWHTRSTYPESAVREWARLHRTTCPLKRGSHA